MLIAEAQCKILIKILNNVGNAITYLCCCCFDGLRDQIKEHFFSVYTVIANSFQICRFRLLCTPKFTLKFVNKTKYHFEIGHLENEITMTTAKAKPQTTLSYITLEEVLLSFRQSLIYMALSQDMV